MRRLVLIVTTVVSLAAISGCSSATPSAPSDSGAAAPATVSADTSHGWNWGAIWGGALAVVAIAAAVAF